MTVWWHSNQRRLRDEKATIAALEAASDWLENVEWSLDDRFRLRAIFDIRLDHRSFRLQLTYHNTYPSSPPSVAPVEDIRVSGHQYGRGGDLCLQIRPDNWRPDYTGADMIASAHALFVEEAPDDEGVVIAAPSDHDVPDMIRMRWASSRLYLSAATQEVFASDAPDGATLSLGLQWCGHEYVVAFVLAIEKDDFSWQPPDVPLAMTSDVYLRKGLLVRAPVVGAVLSRLSTEDELLAVVGANVRADDDGYFCLVVSADGEVVLFRKLPESSLIRYETVAQPLETDSRSGDEFADLGGKRVGIVGLGSLGSKVGASLARTGVGHFVLVDGDVLHAGNVERHDADWRDVGLHKADIAARRLRLLAPGTRCDPWRTAIGAQVSSGEAGNVNAALDGCDLIVDASAEAEVFNHLSGLVGAANTTLVWGATFGGGLGGEVGRSRPLKDPEPFHIRDAISQFYAAADAPPPLAAEGVAYGRDEGGSLLVATDADVSAVASLVTALALDALVEREPSRYDTHAYLIGHARGWIFEGPFHVQPIIANAPLRANPSQPDERAVEKEFVGELIQKKLNEIENRSKDD